MRNKENRAIILVIIINIAYLLLPFLYNSWSERPMNETLLEVIDEREVSRMTFREDAEDDTTILEHTDQETENLVASLEGHDTNAENVNQIAYIPSYYLWDNPVNKKFFGEIEGEISSLVIAFTNEDSETIYFNENEMQIDEDYYTVGYNPLVHMMDSGQRDVLTRR